MWTLDAVLASAAAKFKTREALVAGDRRLSFADLDAAASDAAARLQALGIGPGDAVALQGRNTIDWVVAFFGAVRAGAVTVPINHKLAGPETAYILDHSDARLWLVDRDLAHGADIAGAAVVRPLDAADDGDLPGLFSGAAPGDGPAPVTMTDTDPVEILYTSGTTGRPKGCLHSHANVLLAGVGSSLVYGLGPSDRVLLAMPVWHSFPLNNMLINSIFVGATVVLLPEYHPLHFVQTMRDEGCTLFFGAPIAFLMPPRMLPHFDSIDLSHVRAWIYGGGPIDAGTARMLAERYRSDRFYQVFGMTETGPTGTALYPEEQIAKAGSIGRVAVSGCDLKVMRDTETEAGPGETGEIWLRCQSMMLGYHKDPDATAAAFHDGWYRSGDLARIDEDGYLFIIDRLKDMIVTGGENVYSKEVEDVLAGHPGIAEVAVIGTPHEEWGETVTAIIVARADTAIDEDEVKAHCAANLARYKIPRIIRVVDALPRTPTGKLQKFLLRQGA
ncbi:fatty-acid CoA ligase [Tistrella bauzanensis]|uniref:Fatty-acid CoA ligase n=1 Tax=Tistrella bauzanensis TaxID=657419 RepID=A0ABQ1J045_9PROT|nr:AMP-binding protein [Tistrella bauzanensis]GGB56631.1 fatty-acid CoA ligase [Tistrella bauzanensis]